MKVLVPETGKIVVLDDSLSDSVKENIIRGHIKAVNSTKKVEPDNGRIGRGCS